MKKLVTIVLFVLSILNCYSQQNEAAKSEVDPCKNPIMSNIATVDLNGTKEVYIWWLVISKTEAELTDAYDNARLAAMRNVASYIRTGVEEIVSNASILAVDEKKILIKYWTTNVDNSVTGLTLMFGEASCETQVGNGWMVKVKYCKSYSDWKSAISKASAESPKGLSPETLSKYDQIIKPKILEKLCPK